jgi:hypothetical protein
MTMATIRIGAGEVETVEVCGMPEYGRLWVRPLNDLPGREVAIGDVIEFFTPDSQRGREAMAGR